jgi:hypothetical protein
MTVPKTVGDGSSSAEDLYWNPLNKMLLYIHIKEIWPKEAYMQ